MKTTLVVMFLVATLINSVAQTPVSLNLTRIQADVVSFQGDTNQQYTIECATNLNGNWTLLAVLNGTPNGRQCFTNFPAFTTQMFYRASTPAPPTYSVVSTLVRLNTVNTGNNDGHTIYIVYMWDFTLTAIGGDVYFSNTNSILVTNTPGTSLIYTLNGNGGVVMGDGYYKINDGNTASFGLYGILQSTNGPGAVQAGVTGISFGHSVTNLTEHAVTNGFNNWKQYTIWY